MRFRFARRRYLQELEPGETRAWFAGQTLTALDEEQMREIAGNWAARLDPEEAFTRFRDGDYATFAATFDEMAGVPLEQWDIHDGETPAFHLWLYQVDAGVLYRGGTAEVVGTMIQGFLDLSAPMPRTLLGELEQARQAAVQAAKEARRFPCLLAHFRCA